MLTLMKNDPAIEELALIQLWGADSDLRDRLTKYNRKFSLRVNAQNGKGESVRLDINSTKVPCFALPEDRYVYHIGVDITLGDHALLEEIIALNKAQDECVTRWEAVKEQVVKFLTSCKSLNEALKLWPDVAKYINKQNLDKANQKAEKKVKGESDALTALAAIDMDQVNTSVVLARMAGAKV